MTLSIGNLFKVKEIRTKILITLGLLFCYRIGFHIPLPGVNADKFLADLSGTSSGFGRVLDFMNILTGARLQNASLFSLGVMPYISASIILSLLVKVVPSLEKIAKEGQSGQRKINRYTRYLTIPICILQSFFVLFGSLTSDLLHAGVRENYWLLYCIAVVVCLTASTLFVMWLGEQITEHGAGNGISLIIMAGIVSSLPGSFTSYFRSDGEMSTSGFQTLMLFLGSWALAVVAVVFITKAHRRIPIQQAKQTRGRRVYGGQRHYLPLKVNHAGVMPIIFASAILIVPPIIGGTLGVRFLEGFAQNQGFWYVLSYAALIFFFSFFWTSMMFQPNEMADNLKEHGAFIPGIRPGKNTAEFLEQTMVRITLAGAAFLTILAVFPSLVGGSFAGLDTQLVYFMSGTSILIVVGVALDLVDKLNAMLIMRNYEGFMKDAAGSGRGWGRTQ
ncbi:MAG: preprotein translocase subunit SecY [Planctomycetes bacterium]|nr:preprotein translocase subunit SecY [Planctomycetota bacterium]